MDEQEFNSAAEAMLAKIEAALEAASADIDIEVVAGGVLELELANGSKIIVNRHGAAREIWVAAKSGGYHFKPERDGRWISGRDGEELLAALARCIAEQAGGKLKLGD